MSIATSELIEICEQLPEAKREEVADFARFLLAQQGDTAWEELIASGQHKPKLAAFLAESKAEGSEPLDLNRL